MIWKSESLFLLAFLLRLFFYPTVLFGKVFARGIKIIGFKAQHYGLLHKDFDLEVFVAGVPWLELNF